jgi:hypothetical protein
MGRNRRVVAADARPAGGEHARPLQRLSDQLTRDEAIPYRREHRKAAKRAAADIEGHSPSAKFGQP